MITMMTIFFRNEIQNGRSLRRLPDKEVNTMVHTVFEFICSLLISLVLVEISMLLFVSVHEMFSEKRRQMKQYYKDKRKGGGAK